MTMPISKPGGPRDSSVPPMHLIQVVRQEDFCSFFLYYYYQRLMNALQSSKHARNDNHQQLVS